ncbi:MAG: hypothetical protein EOO01_41010, partial [Chitinophagaceae bacterium]
YIDSVLSEIPNVVADSMRVPLFCEIANSYSRMHDSEGARYADMAFALACRLQDKRGKGIALDALGNAMLCRDNPKAAVSNFRMALLLLKEAGDGTAYVNTVFHIGNAFYGQSKYDIALGYYFKALGQLGRPEDRSDRRRVLNRIVDCYSSQRKYPIAIHYFVMASQIPGPKHAMTFYNGILLGIALFVVFYNLFLLSSIRERSIKYLILLVVSFSCTYILTENFEGNRIKLFLFRTLFLGTVFVNAQAYLKFIYYFLLEYEITIFSDRQLKRKARVIDLTLSIAIALSLLFFYLEIKEESLVTNLLIDISTLICFIQLAYPMVMFFRKGLFRKKGIRFIALAQLSLVVGVMAGIVLAIFAGIGHGMIEY